MRNRALSVLMTLCFVIAGLVAFGLSSPAQATTNWSTTLTGVTPTNLYAYPNGGVVAGPCNTNYAGSNAATYIDSSGTVRSTVPKISNGGQQCVGSYGAEDGTVYGWDYVDATYSTSSTSRLMSWKNGRQLWATSTTSSTTCNFSGSTSEKAMTPSSISQGDDGNIYLILSSMVAPRACPDRLVGLNPATGVMFFNVGIGSGPAPGSGLGGATPTAWTYDDAIVVVDRSGVVREFSYAGTENGSVTYQLPIPTGHRIKYLASTDTGMIFGITETVYSYAVTPKLLYHQRGGGNGSIDDTNAGTTDIVGLQPTHDGNVIALGNWGKRLDYFNLSAGTVSNQAVPTGLSGYSGNVIANYLEDNNGNCAYLWSHYDTTTGNTATSVEVYDAATSTSSRVYLRETKPADLTNYPQFYAMHGMSSDTTANGVTYIALCQATWSTCVNTTTSPSISLEAIDLNNFGLPLGKGFKRNNYESGKLEYVAMGDSFSSGEGVAPFLFGTDVSSPTENRCHRSEHAYSSVLISTEEDLDLGPADFVACSGATIDNVLIGGTGAGAWQEPGMSRHK